MTNPETNLIHTSQEAATIAAFNNDQVSVDQRSSTDYSTDSISDSSSELESRTRLARAAVLGATFAALAFEQSPGNEAVRAALAFNVLDNTNSAVLAGSVVAAATMAIEGTTSTLVSYGLHKEQKSVKRIVGRFRKNSTLEPDAKPINDEKQRNLTTKAGDLTLALAIGPAVAVTKRHIQEAEPTLQNDVKRGLGYSAIGAVVSGGIAYMVTGGVKHAEAIGMEEPAEYVVRYGADPRFWAGVLGIIYGTKAIKSTGKRIKNHLSEGSVK